MAQEEEKIAEILSEDPENQTGEKTLWNPDLPTGSDGGIRPITAPPEPAEAKENEPLPVQRTGGVTVRYRLSKAQGMAALKYLDRKHNMKKRIVFTVLLVALGLYFLITNLLNPIEAEHNLVVSLICLGMAAFYWGIAYLEMNNRAKAIGNTNYDFVLTVYEDSLAVGEAPEEEVFPLEKDIFVQEYRDSFLFSVADEKLFVLEKARMSAEQCTGIRTRLQQKLDEKHFVRSKDADEAPRLMSQPEKQ